MNVKRAYGVPVKTPTAQRYGKTLTKTIPVSPPPPIVQPAVQPPVQQKTLDEPVKGDNNYANYERAMAIVGRKF